MWEWLLSSSTWSVLLFLLGVLSFKILPLLARVLKNKFSSPYKKELILQLSFPASCSVALIFIYSSLQTYSLPSALLTFLYAIFTTLCLGMWTLGLMGCIKTLTEWLKAWEYEHPFKDKSLPLLELFLKVFVILGASYALLITWGVNVGAVLASAGLLGVVLGFAAKDSLSNLFSGFFIMADSPYHLGDYIQLDSGERGYITEIGMRSTRMMTRDDIEVIIPNSILANSKIINESGGHHSKERVRVDVGVSYDSDVDQVKSLLIDLTQGVEGLSKNPSPRVRFREFGDFSLKMQLLIWVDEPALRGKVVDEVNTRILKRFREEGVQIPLPQHVVTLNKEI